MTTVRQRFETKLAEKNEAFDEAFFTRLVTAIEAQKGSQAGRFYINYLTFDAVGKQVKQPERRYTLSRFNFKLEGQSPNYRLYYSSGKNRIESLSITLDETQLQQILTGRVQEQKDAPAPAVAAISGGGGVAALGKFAPDAKAKAIAQTQEDANLQQIEDWAKKQMRTYHDQNVKLCQVSTKNTVTYVVLESDLAVLPLSPPYEVVEVSKSIVYERMIREQTLDRATKWGEQLGIADPKLTQAIHRIRAELQLEAVFNNQSPLSPRRS